jgi:hypothetical protein
MAFHPDVPGLHHLTPDPLAVAAARALQGLYSTETELRHVAWASMKRCRTREHQLVLLAIMLHSPYLDAHADRHVSVIAAHLAQMGSG